MDIVTDYIERARSGDLEQLLHKLRQLDHGYLPAMQAAYRSESDPEVRAIIVQAIWQHRQPSVIAFLAGVLRDPAPEVWKQALDGLVTLASPEVSRILRSVAGLEEDKERRAWIEEAIEQVDDAIRVARDEPPVRCPTCGGPRVLPVLWDWAYLDRREKQQIETGQVILGTRILRAAPNRPLPAWVCLDCEPRWTEVHQLAHQEKKLDDLKEACVTSGDFAAAAAYHRDGDKVGKRIHELVLELLRNTPRSPPAGE